MKYYAVKKGRSVGIFNDWETTKTQVDSFPGAIFKSFNSKKEAEEWMKEEKEVIPKDAYIAYTDGSYDKQTKKSGYGIVILQNDKVIKKLSGHLEEDFYNSHNILGEVYGVLRCIEFCLKSNIKKIYIYHDYQGLSSWISSEYKTTSKIAQFYVKNYQELLKDKKLEVIFVKVKGHSDNKYNDMADLLAKNAIGISK